MADGVLIDPGATTTIATDDTGAPGHVQLFKLAIAANGSATLVPADATGLFVQLGAALPAGANAIGKLAANSGVDIGDVDVTSVVPGTGATNLGKAEDAAHTSGDVGVLALAIRNASLTTLAGTELDYSGIAVDDVGRPFVRISAQGTDGLTLHRTISAATTNATSVKGSGGAIYAIQCFSINAAVRYLKLYNKATAPTVGSDTPVKTLAIPGDTTGSGFLLQYGAVPALFSTGIAFALTTGIADADTGAVAANEIVVNIDYR